MIKLSKRLESISSLVPINSKIIDIGCDHGLLDIYLYQQKITNQIIASDINASALKNAKNNIKKNNLDNIIDTRLGNGLDTLTHEDNIDTIIISGMGGHTIVDILTKDLSKLKNISTIIIQSNTKVDYVRKEITKLNYIIEDEILLEDNKKIYTIVKFITGTKKYTKRELYFGPVLLNKNPILFQTVNNQEQNKLKKLLSSISKKKIITRYKIKQKIKMYESIK